MCDKEEERFSSCPKFESLTTETLSDKYLLTDLNLSCCHRIIRHSATPQYLVPIYSSAIQSNYPENCAGRCVLIRTYSCHINVHLSHLSHFRSGVLSNSIVNYLLVGAVSHKLRVELVKTVMRSDLAQHLLDAISKSLREKLNTTSTSRPH